MSVSRHKQKVLHRLAPSPRSLGGSGYTERMCEAIASRIKAEFRQYFGEDAVVLVRAPGRVNLIGEHTDYSRLPVLPFCIQRSTWVAGRPTNDGVVRIHSRQMSPPARLHRAALAMAVPRPTWHRYIAGALTELVDLAPSGGAELLVDSDLPRLGGLSSSSALTVGLMLALDHLWQGSLARDELIARAIVAERHVGVEGGGMDQTVIVYGITGRAMRIDFAPPSTRAIAMPSELRFVIAYSGGPAPKVDGAREAYNRCVVGARIASQLLASGLRWTAPDELCLGTIAKDRSLEALIEASHELPAAVSAHEVAQNHGIEVDRLVRLTADRFDAHAALPVRAIARHILSETQRVGALEQALASGALETVGEQLDASHRSLAEDYLCSTPALDELCDAMRHAGALGAKLTGAGFGGFALAAATEANVPRIIDVAKRATGGPAFEVFASDGATLVPQ